MVGDTEIMNINLSNICGHYITMQEYHWEDIFNDGDIMRSCITHCDTMKWIYTCSNVCDKQASLSSTGTLYL